MDEQSPHSTYDRLPSLVSPSFCPQLFFFNGGQTNLFVDKRAFTKHKPASFLLFLERGLSKSHIMSNFTTVLSNTSVDEIEDVSWTADFRYANEGVIQGLVGIAGLIGKFLDMQGTYN